ncbi:hypothetical protein ES703_17927 [subsurface metagenome]
MIFSNYRKKLDFNFMRLLIKTETAVLNTLLKIQERYRKTYSCVKLITIRNYVKKYYGIAVSKSDISYHLGKFYGHGILRYWKRSRREVDGTYTLLASNRQITGKGISFLLKSGIKVANMLKNWAFKGIKPEIYKDVSDLPHKSDIITTAGRRPAGQPESLSDVLSKINYTIY